MIWKRRLLENEDLEHLDIFGIKDIEYETTIDTGWYDIKTDDYKFFDIYSTIDKDDNIIFIAVNDNNDYSDTYTTDYELINVTELNEKDGTHILETIRMLGSYINKSIKVKDCEEELNSIIESRIDYLDGMEEYYMSKFEDVLKDSN